MQALAEWFVAGALVVEVEVMELEDLEVEPIEPQVAGDGEEPNAPSDRTGHSTVERPIWPSLQCWAAALLVSRDPGRWRGLWDAAEVLPSRDGDALAAGVMDASSHMPVHHRSDAVATGLAWGSGIVRLAALPALADFEGTEAALARAAGDPSAKVRAWTPKPIPSPEPSKPVSSADDQGSAGGATGQARLF